MYISHAHEWTRDEDLYAGSILLCNRMDNSIQSDRTTFHVVNSTGKGCCKING